MKAITICTLFAVFTLLQACSTNPQNGQFPRTAPSYSAATTNSSYIFRSPPPAAMSQGVIRAPAGR